MVSGLDADKKAFPQNFMGRVECLRLPL